jgi:3-oxoacyl-[acyl-carrier-protein] synthase II
MKTPHRVMITGLGWNTSLGPNLETCWRRLVAGESGIRPISFWDPAAYTAKLAAEVRDIPRETGLPSVPPTWCRRSARLFLPVVREAFADANLDAAPVPSEEIGIAAGASVNYIDHRLIREYFSRWDKIKRTLVFDPAMGRTRPEVFARRTGDMMAAVPARLLHLGGPTLAVDTACAASSHAIGEAYRLIRRGRASAMIAGGSAALVSPLGIIAFSLLGALSRSSNPSEASRPFDRLRDGFVMGEGAGAIVLESLESAQRRGARIYGEIAGYGSTSNAGSLTDPSADGHPEARAMAGALAEAGLRPEEVDYIAAHGTSTQKNDATETQAIKRLFGDHARQLLVSSNKGQIGHTISAAGVSNVICAVKAINGGIVPPTMNLRNPDTACDLDYVPNQSRTGRIRNAVANAFAFGGQNTALAIRAWSGA